MHMANELLSVPVAAGTCAAAAAALGYICHKAKKLVSTDDLALMGIMGAFVFAAQMVNFQLPFMPGVSGHMIGAVLLAIMLGPYAAAIVITSVVIVQCLIFQDGGLLALGCNIINMAIVPSFIGYGLYRLFAGFKQSRAVFYTASVVASLGAVLAGAVLVPLQTAFSGVLMVPFRTFVGTMAGVHIIIGIIEGLITAAVLVYLRQVRPEIIADCPGQRQRLTRKALYATLIVATVIIGAVLSLFASSLPDGLEWSYAHRPDEPGFASIISNESTAIEAVDNLQARFSPLPDYTTKRFLTPFSAGWKSFVAVFGSGLTMFVIWLTGRVLRNKNRDGHQFSAK